METYVIHKIKNALNIDVLIVELTIINTNKYKV